MKMLGTILRRLTDRFHLYTKKSNIAPLGRWNIDYCNKKVDKKIDLSNEDHCGPCGQYIINQEKIQSSNISKETNKKSSVQEKEIL
jgi:hypothetical protein